MHHFVTQMCTNVHISVTKWCIVGYGTGALWDLCNRSVGPNGTNISEMEQTSVKWNKHQWNGTNISEILIKTHNFFFNENALKMSPADCQPFCPSLSGICISNDGCPLLVHRLSLFALEMLLIWGTLPDVYKKSRGITTFQVAIIYRKLISESEAHVKIKIFFPWIGIAIKIR